VEGIAAALPNELALVARAAAEPAAFGAVYDHYFPRVYNYVCYRVGDTETANDLTAKIFERVLVNIGRYRPKRAAFATWLFTVARNCVSDHIRAQKRRPCLPLATLDDHRSSDPEPEEIIVRKEAHAELLAAVSCLSDRQRNLVALKFGAGLTNRSIAELTGLSESNVGVILYRTIRKLRDELDSGVKDHG
jgi:RNA polymerase sigma-70 factor (ECF subfamily)